MTAQIIYPEPIEQAIALIESWLNSLGESNVLKQYSLSTRSLALLLLQKDSTLWETLAQDHKQQQEIEILLTVTQNKLQYPVDLAIAETRQKQARSLEVRTIQAT
ncbi:MAG: ferrous iron transporter B, partial [Cyanobacteria bacterium J06633_1]